MVINGKKVDANYDAVKKELAFESTDPMPAGTYEVLAKVKVDNWANFERKWTVTIRPDAMGPVVEAPNDARAAFDTFNQIRKEHGFDAYRLDSHLQMSATSHTNYLFLNRECGHYEESSKPGFTGQEPNDRMTLFGHVGSNFEVVSMGGTDAADGVRGLWDAPYHRISMMQPGPGIMGASFKDTYFTMDGQGSPRDGAFVSPPANGRDIPALWHNREFPDPTRSFDDASKDLGYPIVMNVYGKDVKKLSILSCKVSTGSGEDVPRYELSSDNDEHLNNSVIIIPKKPLGARSTYSVNLRVRDNNGKIYEKAWSFTTK